MREPLGTWIRSTARQAAWAPALVFLLHVVASRIFHAYAVFPPLDMPMHFIGGVAIAFFFLRSAVIASGLGLLAPPHRATHFLLVFGLVGTTTVFWELAELASDRFFGTHAQLGLADTLKDMFFGISGGLAFLVALTVVARVRDATAEGLAARSGSTGPGSPSVPPQE